MVTPSAASGNSPAAPCICIDLGSALVKWSRSGDVQLRDVLRTPAATAAQLRSGRERDAINAELVPILQMILHNENIATLPLGATPPTIAILTGDHSNPDVLAAVRDYFVLSARVQCTVLSSAAAALAAGGVTSGIVVDIGRKSTRCHAVAGGLAIPRASRVSPRGFECVIDALRRGMLAESVIRDKHAKRVQGEGIIENTLVSSSIVAPPEASKCAQRLEASAADAVNAQREESLAAQVPIMLRFDIVPIKVAPAYEALFAAPDGEHTFGLPIGSLIAETLGETNRSTQLGDASSAICIVGSCSDVPGFRRRLVEESIAYARSADFDAPDGERIAEALLDAVVVKHAPYSGWAAAAIGGTLLLEAGY